MDKNKNVWDQVAAEQAAIRHIASQARTVYRRMGSLSQTDLVKMFLAICQAGESYDPECKYREKILSFLPDWIVGVEFAKIKMPVRLIKLIEDRLRPPHPPDPGSVEVGGVMLTPQDPVWE
jgi:hypothetical protein